MLRQLGSVSDTMKGLGVLTSTQRPFVQFLVKNWVLTAIAGYALFVRGKERWNKGELTPYNAFADVGLIITPLVGLALLNNLANEEQARKTAAAAAAPASTSAASTDTSIAAAALQAASSAFGPSTST